MGRIVTKANIAEEPKPVEKPRRPFDQNIEGAIIRLHVANGQVSYCDAVVLTQHDLVVTIPKSDQIPARGERARCSIFLVDDENFVLHRDGIVHWEMTLHGERLCGVFLDEPIPEDLLELTVRDQRREVRFPASLSCEVRGDNESVVDGRLMNYSLNGLAAQLAEPLDIGCEYTIAVQANGETLKLSGVCRWNIETPHGFINGCSLDHHEGQQFARPAFRGTVMPWDIQRTTPAVSIRPMPQRRQQATVPPTRDVLRPLVTRTTILVLSLVLLWLAAQIQNQMTNMTFLTGCIGLVTYIGLDWTSKLHLARRKKLQAEKEQTHAESRLHAHLSRQREVETAEQAEPATTIAS